MPLNGLDSNAQNRALFVTHVTYLGPYLKVCGQLNHAALELVHGKIQQLLSKCTAIDPTWPLARHQALLEVGMVCLYKRVNSNGTAPDFVRVRVLSVATTSCMQVEIELIDYGYTTQVGSYELLLLDKSEDITAIPALCSQCIVLGVCSDWIATEIDEVKRIILDQTLEISIKMEVQQYKLITMKWKDFNFTEYLIHQKQIGLPVPNDLLFDGLSKLLGKAATQTKNVNVIETKRNNKMYEHHNKMMNERANTLMEPVPVMPPVFSGPNNHRQQSIESSVKRTAATRLQYANNFTAQPLNAQYVTQQHMNMTHPRVPQNIGNLRAMYPAPIIYASTPGTYAVPPNALAAQHNMMTQLYAANAANNVMKQEQITYNRTCPATFKSNSLTVGSTYDVYVSFVENGPCLFSIQLASAEQQLTEMMNLIERMPLKMLTEKPALGSACIARYSEDGQLYRALIVGVQPNVCKVAYIDYGNAELVQFRHLFEIPDEFLTQKPFAIRFTLSGYKDLQPLDDSLKKAFKDLVLYHHCKLEVMPLEGPPLVQYCKLYLKNENVLDILKKIQKTRLVYAKAEDLTSNDIVEIRYIDSPKHFYVQKVSNIIKFEALMDEMFLYYNKNQVVPTTLTLGAPCIVKYDNEWYRAEVMRADDTAIIVRHVDFGYEQLVTKHLLSNIAEQHLQLPRQAVQCCLKGFENADVNKENTTKLFEMLAEESNLQRRSFNVKVFRIQPDGVNLVNLFTKDLNVMKKLYKMSMPFEQYLSLEKEDFNITGNQNEPKEVPQKTPSIASSDAISSVHSSKKNTNMSKKYQTTTEQTKDLRPQLNGQNKQQKRQQNGRQNAAGLNTSTDSRSSDKGSESSRQTNSSQAKSVRSKNAPQGYSQSRQKANNTKSKTEPQQVEEIKVVEEYVPLDYVFPTETIRLPKLEDVIICWWISPHQFYTHLKRRSADFERLMSEMQRFYAQKPLQPLQLRVGANVIAKHRQDNLVYRARVVGCNHMLRKYKVYFVDYGNQYTVTSEDIWQVEKRFSNFPCMAYLCAFKNVISNYDHLHIIDCMDKYLPPGAALTCEYVTHEPVNKSPHTGGCYYVNVKVNGKLLREVLIQNGFLTNVDNELRLDLFAGQQIRAKICEIKDLLNFKIHIDDLNLKLLSAFDDVRFVKSNPHLSKKFLKYYEDKTCVVNIKEVNDNKVLLLRPMAPLFKEENRPYICAPAVCFAKFPAYIMHVASISRVYAQPVEYSSRQDKLVEQMYEFYENNGEILQNIDLHKICAALSEDKNWYRARIENIEDATDLVTVYLIDYGNTEQVAKQNLKQLEMQFYQNEWANASVVEINLPIRSLEKAKMTAAEILTAFSDLVLEQEFYIKPLEVRRNHVIADILTKEDDKNEESIIDILMQKQLIKSRDLDYAKKQLEKDKKNMYEYIETVVDLTLEDEVETAEKQQKYEKKTAAKIISEELNKSTAESDTSFSETAISTSTSHIEAKSVVASVPVETLQQPVVEESVKPKEEKVMEKAKEIDLFAHMEKAILSHCDNPAQFFIHSQSKVEELRKLQENLQIVASSLPPLMGLHNGAHCISQYSVDKQWYRARVIDAELMLLKYIDFGNTDCVSDASELREMNVFPDIAPLCMPCGLPIKPNCTIDWVDAANNIFNEAYGKLLHYQYITRGDNDTKSYINLYIEGVNIADKLIADGYAKHLEIVKSDENCYISHVNGICDFYIQYEKDSKALELIEIYLADNVNASYSIEKFEKGMVVAALFPDDEMWYRAKLLQINADNTYEVLFIDYGNTSTSPEVHKIASEIANLPALSKKCCLELPSICTAWSEAAEAKFSELAAQGETIFTIVLREPKVDCPAVHLLIDGHNINDDLIPLCPQVPADDMSQEYGNNLNNSFCNTTFHSSFGDAPVGTSYESVICHVNAVSDFYVHFNKDSERLNDLNASLKTLREAPKLEFANKDDLVAVLWDENRIARARVFEKLDTEWRVFLLDYGKEIVTAELRELPQGLQQVKPFAKHCTLETTTENEQMLNSTPFLESLKELDATVLNIELISGANDPALVRLYDINTHENVVNKIIHEMTNSKLCMISHALSHEHFYIQRKKNLLHLELVTKTLQKIAGEELTELQTVNKGDICVAYSSEDDLYYRALVTETQAPDINKVYLLDYGNVIICSQLYIMPQDLQHIPHVAEKCALDCVFDNAIDTAVLETQFNSLVDLHFGEFFEIASEKEVGDVKQLQLNINYEILVDCLIKAAENALEEGSDAEDSTPLRAILHDCTIIHVNSPQDFYIQLSENMPDLEKITDTLLDAATNYKPVTERLEKGALCAALFPEDEIYYRARIVQQVGDEAQYEVHYIDFGNNAITDKILELPTDMQQTAAIAKNCTLHGLREPLSLAVSEQFQSLVDARFSETFQVEFLKTDVQPMICNLFYQQRSVATEITELLNSTGEVTDEKQKDEDNVD